MQKRKLIAVLAAAASASACTTSAPSGPAPDRAAFAVPSTGTAVTPASRWWSALGDRGLDRAVDRALAGNLTLAAAVERIVEARATAASTRAGALPTLDGSASATRSRGGMESWSGTLRASWESDIFGGAAAAGANADAQAASTASAADAARLALVADVASAFVEARGHQARLALAGRTLSLQNETLAMTRAKLEAGAASGLDVTRAEGLVADTKAGLPSMQGALDKARTRLSVLLGASPGEVAELLGKGTRVPAPTVRVASGVPADLVRNRPDLRGAQADLTAAAAAVGVSEAALYPSLRLAGNLSLNAATLSGLRDDAALGWSFGPSIDVPLLDAGARRANVEVAGSRLRQSEIAYRAAVRSAVGEVEVALAEARAQSARLPSLRKSAAAAEEALRMSRNLYDAGSVDFIDVLDAERSVQSARDVIVQNETATAQAFVEANRALGGGWATR